MKNAIIYISALFSSLFGRREVR